MTNKKCVLGCLKALLIVAGLIVVDQWTKQLAVLHLQNKPPIVLIDGMLELLYTENRGMAFGLLQNQRTIFILVTIVVVCGLCFFYTRIPHERRFLPIRAAVILIVAGAIGNFIDRIRLSYVIDFIYIKLIDFPVFNIADCFVTMTAFWAFLLLMFFYKEEDMKRLGL